MQDKTKSILITVLAIIVLAAVISIVYFILTNTDNQNEKLINPPLIGIVSFGGAHEEVVNGLIEGMRKLGYEKGKNINYIIKDAQSSEEEVRKAAQRFMEQKVNVIYTASTPVTKTVYEVVGDKIPIVFNIVSDPVKAGFAESMDIPGKSLTGCSNFVGQSGPKRLEILKMILPEAKNILVLYDPQNIFSQDAIKILREAAPNFGMTLVEKHIRSKKDIEEVMSSIKPGEYDAFFHLGEAKVSGTADLVIKYANKVKLPTIAHEESFVERGMLAAYGPSWYKLGQQCAETFVKVLQGVNPGDIPVQIPKEFELVLNLKTAKEIEIELPEKVLRLASKIILAE